MIRSVVMRARRRSALLPRIAFPLFLSAYYEGRNLHATNAGAEPVLGTMEPPAGLPLATAGDARADDRSGRAVLSPRHRTHPRLSGAAPIAGQPLVRARCRGSEFPAV